MNWHYNSIDALRNVRRQTACNADNQGELTMVLDHTSNNFAGFSDGTRDQHLAMDKMLTNGWPTGVRHAQKLANRMSVQQPQSRKRRRRRGPVGGDIDMDRVYSGQLDTAWTKTARLNKSAPATAHILVNTTVPARKNSDVIYWRGAVAWQLCQQLEQSGYSVRVSIACPVILFDGHDTEVTITVDVKQSYQRMNPTSMIAGIAHPAIFRLYMLAAIYQRSEYKVGSGLGKPDYGADVAPHGHKGSKIFTIGHDVEGQKSAQNAMNRFVNC